VSEDLIVKELANGMTLLGQRMEHVASAAMTIAVPAGAAHDPSDSAGAASVISEWSFRGAGGRDTHGLNDALDALGCRHHESVLSAHLQLSTAQLGRNLGAVLATYADILRRPALADATFEPARALIVQDLASLEDEPARKSVLMLRERFYPRPLGRCVYGTAESLGGMTVQRVRRHAAEVFAPRGVILSVAGQIDWEAFCDLAESYFSDWRGDGAAGVATETSAGGVTHIEKDSAQVHIALAHKAACMSDRRYYAARIAEAVLSGGMSGRLFTEVREKRGLAYHVSASYHSLKDHAGIFTYAGTVGEKAQETFDVTVRELRRLQEGIEQSELARAQTQLKSSLVMQGESPAARANALAADWYYLRRLRSLKEISQAIDAVTADDVLECLAEYPAEKFTVLVIGPELPDTGAIER